MASRRNRNTKSYGVSFRWIPKSECRLKADFPLPNRCVIRVVEVLLIVLLLTLIAKLTGLELSAVLALIKPVTAMLS